MCPLESSRPCAHDRPIKTFCQKKKRIWGDTVLRAWRIFDHIAHQCSAQSSSNSAFATIALCHRPRSTRGPRTASVRHWCRTSNGQPFSSGLCKPRSGTHYHNYLDIRVGNVKLNRVRWQTKFSAERRSPEKRTQRCVPQVAHVRTGSRGQARWPT